MGIKFHDDNVRKIFVGYSSFIGSLFIDNDANRKLITKAKEHAGGDDVAKKGFVGFDANSASGKARNFLKDNDVPLGFKVEGNLRSVHISEVSDAARGLKLNYLKVLLEDKQDDGVVEKIMLSVNMNQELAEKMIQKLNVAKPGEHIELSAWAEYGPSEKDPSKSYAGHNTSIKQNGEELKVPADVKHYDKVKELVEAKFAKLNDAGFNKEADKDMFSKTRQSTTADYYKRIVVESIEPRFKQYRVAEKDTLEHDEHRDPMPPEAPAVTDDDISLDPADAEQMAA